MRRKAYFNPRPPRGGRLSFRMMLSIPGVFQSTPPARGATDDPAGRLGDIVFQSTPPARGATVPWTPWPAGRQFQSTPPARGATWWSTRSTALNGISIHAPREGGDGDDPAGRLGDIVFQSTPPARGATLVLGWLWRDFEYFNPRPPRGGRQQAQDKDFPRLVISIHAPREGGDSRPKTRISPAL